MKKKGIARILATIVIIGSMNTSFTYALENKHTGESSYAKIGKKMKWSWNLRRLCENWKRGYIPGCLFLSGGNRGIKSMHDAEVNI